MTNFLIFLIYEIQWEQSTGGLKDFKIKNIQIMEADFSELVIFSLNTKLPITLNSFTITFHTHILF